jgi:hypothetical protein
MKKLLLLFAIAFSLGLNSQTFFTVDNLTTDSTQELLWYHTNGYDTMRVYKFPDSLTYYMPVVVLQSLDNTHNAGRPAAFVSTNATGRLLRSPVDSIFIPVGQITGTLPISKGGTGITAVGSSGQLLRSSGTSYQWFTPTYLTSFTETDPEFNTKFAAKTTTGLSEGTNLYYTQSRFDAAFAAKTTTGLLEGANLYYTASRFNTAFSGKSTSDLAEGSNLYYTDARFDTRFGTKTTSNLTEGSNLYFTNTRARSAISLTTTGTSGAATYNNSTGVLNVPQYAAASRSFNNTPSHSIVTTATAANGFQLSTTRDVDVNYSVTIVTSATIGGASSGMVVLEICPTNSSTAGDWQEVARVPNGQSITLAVALQSVQTIGGGVGCIVPAGYYVRLRSIIVSGTPTFTYNSGQEVQL